MQSIFKVQPEVPPAVLVVIVAGLILWLVPPALHLGPLGSVVTGALALALAFAMAARVKTGQAERRAAARPLDHA